MSKSRWPILDAVLGPIRRRREQPSWIIVGLGNPGPEYAQTRHNVGFWCVDRLASDHSIAFSRHRSTLIGEGVIDGHRVVLAKPRTFMNRSGEAVVYLLARYRVSPQELLVVYDDMDLPVGKIRLRPSGSAGGHKGMKSITESVGTQDFPRLRFGIGRAPEGSDAVEYVLGTMPAEEDEAANAAVLRIVEAVAGVLNEGVSAAMNRFN